MLRTRDPTMEASTNDLSIDCPRFGVTCLAWLVAVTSAAATGVGQLRCEHLANPLGIDVTKPRLSWTIDSDQRGVKQQAWQVLVASSPEKLAANQADLWDSGKVASDQSVLVEYAGKNLTSRQPCFWKVRVWTTAGNGGAVEATSEPAMWTMGLLRADDFKAQWIGAPTDAMVEPAPLLRKTFSLDKKIKRATAYVCGLGYHELSLNGKKVGDHELDPKFTRYDRRVLYVTHDVTKHLQAGKNAVGLILGNGWYNYHVKNAWDFDTAPWRAKAKALLQLEIEFADGSTTTVVSDESWKYSTGPIRFDGMLSGEVYDARLEQPGWDTPAFDDLKWVAAKQVAPPQGKLTAQMVPPIRVTETIKPVKITQPKPGIYLADFGQNIAGKARLVVSGPAGHEVKLQYAELLHPDGTLNAGNINSFCKGAEFQTERYLLKGQGTETWQSRFMYHGFQYVQITGFPGKIEPEDIQALVMHTDLANAGSFECSNPLLNQIQHCTRWSYLNNFHGHPTDCPNREKNGWTGDAHLAAETGLYNFDAAASYTQWMRDFQDEQRPGGELPGIVPTGGWGYHWGNGPAWDSAYVLIPWYLYQYRGDLRILAEHHDNLKRYVDYLTTKAKNGIVAIGLGDWCPAKTGTPEKVTSTGYYYRDAVIVSQIAALLGKQEEAATYGKLAESIRTAFNREFLNQQTNQYAGGTQTAMACALYQGLADPANVAAVASNLVANVERRDNHLDCGILGTKYLLHALTDNGRADVAYKVTTQTTAPSWGHWIKQGATTLWENWNGDGTHNHVMFGDVSAWFYQTLAGIRPDSSAPGFKKIIIEPHVVGDLTSAQASHLSGYGRITSAWKLDGNRLTLSVTIPPNTTARILVPSKGLDDVKEGGTPVTKAAGLTSANQQGERTTIETGSGNFVFTSLLK